MNMKVTILGSGSVQGAPVYGCSCKACARARLDERFKRGATSALVEAKGFRLLIDAGLTDLCERFPAGDLTHILLTHYHMDHVQGLFHLRWGENINISVIGPDDPNGCDDLYRNSGILDFSKKTADFETFNLGPFSITPLPLIHSKLTHGYLIEYDGSSLAYLTDTNGLSDTVVDYLIQHPVKLTILDCSTPVPEPVKQNHNDLPSAVEIHHKIQSEHTIITHIGHTLDEWFMDHPNALPKGMSIARDGLEISLSDH